MNQLSRADQAKVLRDFLSGDLSSADFRKRLAAHMSIEGDWGHFSIDVTVPLEVNVAVHPHDLLPMLERYLAWRVDDDELARWASLIVMLGSYTNPIGLSDEESDKLMNPMWDVFWDLSVPTILGTSFKRRLQLVLSNQRLKLAARVH